MLLITQLPRIIAGLIVVLFTIWLIVVFAQYEWPTNQPEKTKQNHATPSAFSIAQAALPPLPNHIAQPSNQKNSTKAANQPTLKVPVIAPQVNLVSPITEQKIYQDLTKEGVDVQIAWPQNTSERQSLIEWMYHCVGVQFAVLNDRNITRMSKPPAGEISDWIRVAQGMLSTQEQNWLAAFALSGTPIRLFPRYIDLRLANHIASELQGSPLTLFRATYQLHAGTLQLTNIRLNDRTIYATWPLYQGACY